MNSGTSWREELVRRLREVERRFRETCFVLLWSYFVDGDEWLVDAENLLVRQGVFPTDIEGLPLPPEGTHLGPWIAEITQQLENLEGDQFDLFALKWLRTLDGLLEQRIQRRRPQPIAGLYDRKFQVYRRISLVASKLTELHPSTIAVEEQSNHLEAYARNHKAVPAGPIRGHGVHIESRTDWGDRLLQSRLGSQLGPEKGRFRVLIWPLGLQLRYSGLTGEDLLELGRKNPGKTSFVDLSAVDNEDHLVSDVLEALAIARTKKATILLLPELAIPPTTANVISETLKSHGINGFPVLTLFGCSHRKVEGQESSVNEAVLLGPNGKEILRHKKLTRYKGDMEIQVPGENDTIVPLAERIETGKVLAIFECAFGNLAPVICLDLFGKVGLLEISHANLLAVPSLSPKVSPHLSAAKTLMATNKACTFVANHWVEECGAGGRSFYITPVRPDKAKEMGHATHWNQAKRAPDFPYLLFDLPSPQEDMEEPEANLDKQTKVK